MYARVRARVNGARIVGVVSSISCVFAGGKKRAGQNEGRVKNKKTKKGRRCKVCVVVGGDSKKLFVFFFFTWRSLSLNLPSPSLSMSSKKRRPASEERGGRGV